MFFPLSSCIILLFYDFFGGYFNELDNNIVSRCYCILYRVLKVKQEEAIKAQIFSVIKGKPYEEHVVRRIHFVENDPKRRRKQDKQVRVTASHD